MISDRSSDVADVRATIAELHESHFATIARYCALRIGNLSEAEDLASEVFIRAIRHADKFRNGTDSLVPWMYRTAYNLSIDHIRRRARRGVPRDIDDVPEQAAPDSVEATVERSLQFQTLVSAMDHLSEAERQVISLRFSDGLRAEEVGTIMDKSAGAVRQMQHSALKKLRSLLSWGQNGNGSEGH